MHQTTAAAAAVWLPPPSVTPPARHQRRIAEHYYPNGGGCGIILYVTYMVAVVLSFVKCIFFAHIRVAIAQRKRSFCPGIPSDSSARPEFYV